MPMFKVNGGKPATEVPVVAVDCATAASGANKSSTTPKRSPVIPHPIRRTEPRLRHA